jgi:hypothetical protein
MTTNNITFQRKKASRNFPALARRAARRRRPRMAFEDGLAQQFLKFSHFRCTSPASLFNQLKLDFQLRQDLPDKAMRKLPIDI